MKRLVAVITITMTLAAIAEKQPFERYQSIIDRQMFGKPPPGFDPTRPPSEVSKTEQRELTKEQEKLQSSIHFSVIRVSPEGVTQVGFTDNSDPKAPKNYVLAVGEQSDGWLVREADAAGETMTIVKDDIEVSLKIGDNSGKGGGTTARGGGNNAAAAADRSGARSGMAPRASGGLLGMGSLRERRKQRAIEAQAQRDEDAAKAAEKAAQERAEREAQQAQDRAEREADRAQQKAQLEAIQEELRKARELNAKRENESKANNEENASE